jgi:hypothetical protein
MDRKEAIKATKNGAVAGCVYALINSLGAFLALFIFGDDGFSDYNDPLIFGDVAIVLALAYGVYKKSRIAAVILFFLYLYIVAISTLETGFIGSRVVISLLFLFYYGNAIQGAFVFHRIEKSEKSEL